MYPTATQESVVANEESVETLVSLERPRDKAEAQTTLLELEAPLPPFERCDETTTWSWVGIGVSSILGIGCTVTGIVLASQRGGHQPVSMSETAMETTLLVVNFAVTLCIDCMGYVHAASLRWALYREGRLGFNTNLRLLRGATSSAPNRWPCNLAIAFCLVLCYASTSQLIINYARLYDHPPADGRQFSVNFIAMAALGLGLVGQAVPAILCMLRSDSHVVSWSSNPLNNALAVLHRRGTVIHRPGRCMKGLSQADEISCPSPPVCKHRSLWQLKCTRWIILLLWILSTLPFLGVIGITAGFHASPGFTPLNWTVKNVKRPGDSYDVLPMAPYGTTTPSAQLIICILFLWAVQGVQAICLHCTELLVNMRRDEKAWRRAGSARGATLAHPPLVAVLRSWEAALLFVFKALLHWLLGMAAQSVLLEEPGSARRRSIVIPPRGVNDDNGGYWPGYGMSLYLNYTILLIYGFLCLLVVAFSMWLALYRPRGYQPATWGHIQTIADLVDDWGASAGGRIWWGDKEGGEDGVRHAGTASSPGLVGPIDSNRLYAGGRATKAAGAGLGALKNRL